MSFEELGAIKDPMDLGSTGFVAPILVRYVVRTDQLQARYAGASLPTLLRAINVAAAHAHFPPEIGQLAPRAVRSAIVDRYLDGIAAMVRENLNAH
ncbi:hypothetical protein D7S86_27105 [Pararobbsia silviterrae]|uniref:Uncharacterized protein n=2 Tax=Pararobbsia silviterrae TaxID=1792498 RepID=A0A494X4U1_9BURK|nr:hypothetical protein D7S86_27105 [Pararobbsia silviterrae]